MQLDKIKDQPPIPMLRTAVYRDLKLAGKTVRVHKPRARQASMVAQRLMESFGETLVRVFVSPEEELKKVFDGEIEVSNWQLFRLVFTAGFAESALERLKQLGNEIGPDHLFWYFENMLEGEIELDGYRFKSMEEMDDSGFGMVDYFSCLQAGIELAIYPTSDDPDTGDGKSDQKPPDKARRVEREKKAPRAKKRRGATDMDGQSVQMSARSG